MPQTPEHSVSSVVEPQAAVSPTDVREALQCVLASAPFLRSQRPSHFLRFIVESSLAGKEDQIKEYLIGVEVFARAADYDPKDDPVVRIEAGRLRKKLAEYYGRAGANDPVIIEVPKGGYVPSFRFQPPQTESSIEPKPEFQAEPDTPKPVPGLRSRTFRVAAAALAFAAAAAIASAYFVRSRQSSLRAPVSIVVLPFLNLSGAPDAKYLSEGVAEELTTGLAQLKDLRVVAATSAFQFQDKVEDVRMIGRALNAEALLEGSIRQSAQGLRVNAQLIDTRNGFHLWSKAYDVQSTELLASEQDIVLETGRALRIPAANLGQQIKRDTENAEAHDLYLHGRYLWNTRQLPNMLASARLFERAIKDDPDYALAYVGLADAYTVMAVNEQMSPALAIPPARAAIEHALQLDPNSAQAHATLGLLKSQCLWDWHGAEQEFRRAIELQPNYAEAHHWAGLNYMVMGQFAAAEAELRQAQILNPLSLMITEGLAENFFFARRFDQTVATVLNMPDRRFGWVILARAYISKGMYRDALKVIEAARTNDVNTFAYKAQALALSGDLAGARNVLKGLELDSRKSDASRYYISPTVLGITYALLGEKERALASLEKAYLQHDPVLADLKIDPGFDSLRADPRYLNLLGQMRLKN